jgi:RNA polymerase sigma-70 factor (ECF subfamily)
MYTTSPTLLERLRQSADEAAWRQLAQLYTPLLFYWARRCGESEQDAADLVQDVFVTLLQTLPTFRSDKSGQFRGWLRTVILNKLRDRKRREATANKALAQHGQAPDLPDVAEAYWETEYRQDLARRALQLMQAEFAPATWKSCWETVVEGRSIDAVARELGMSENAVYIARCRVLRRLREQLAGLVEW